MCKIERSWTISGVFKAKAEKVVTSSKRFSQERRWRQEKRKMCLKQNLEAAKLCRVERQMTEEGIIFSIYSCLHLLFLHVLSFSFCIRLDDVFRYEENYSNCLDPLKTQFVIKLPVRMEKFFVKWIWRFMFTNI